MTACKHWFEGMVARSEAACPFCEIETLRLRVKEFEAENKTLKMKLAKECNHSFKAWEELATLKQAQGEAVPFEVIGNLLTQAMDQAVANGANSRSMPDGYVEIACWLSRAAPKPGDQA